MNHYCPTLLSRFEYNKIFISGAFFLPLWEYLNRREGFHSERQHLFPLTGGGGSRRKRGAWLAAWAIRNQAGVVQGRLDRAVVQAEQDRILKSGAEQSFRPSRTEFSK